MHAQLLSWVSKWTVIGEDSKEVISAGIGQMVYQEKDGVRVTTVK